MPLSIIASIIVIALAYIVICLYLYIMYVKLDEIEKHLATAKWIPFAKRSLRGVDFVSRYHRANMIFVLLLFPATFIKRGEIQAHEIPLIPKYLRRLILGTLALGGVTLVAFAATYGAIQLSK